MLLRNHLLEEEYQLCRPLPLWKRMTVRIGFSLLATVAAGLLILAPGSQTINFMVTEVVSSTIGSVNEGTTKTPEGKTDKVLFC